VVTAVAKGKATITATTKYAQGSANISVGPDIYVAGQIDGINTLWKNGKIFWTDNKTGILGKILVSGSTIYMPVGMVDGAARSAWLYTDGTGEQLSTAYSEAYAIALSGSDIYVAGFESDEAGNAMPALWTNGVIQYLGTDTGFANDVTVDGSNIYVAGSVGIYPQYATVWENGRQTQLSSFNSSATAVQVVNGTVYVCGAESDESYTQHATLWVDGVAEHLHAEYARSSAMFVDANGTAYVTGYYGTSDEATGTYYTKTVVWHNGEETALNAVGTNANSRGIYVSNGVVYVVGIQQKVTNAALYEAMLWIDGVATPLESSNKWSDTEAFSVFVVE
jgi:hypothetical protein